MVKLFANSEDPDQTPRSAASDLGLHCLPITLFGVSRLQWAKSFRVSTGRYIPALRNTWILPCMLQLILR